MTDLPKLSPREFQTMINTLNTQAANAQTLKPTVPDETDATPERFDAMFAEGVVDPPTHKNTDAENAAIARYCGCDCDGCTSTSTHCIKPPCRRQKNRRTQAELDAAGRYPNGRVREAHVAQQIRKSPKPRTPEEIEAAGRYPNGRARPNRSNWTDAPRSKRVPAAEAELPAIETVPRPDPLAQVVTWFVRARRGTTLMLPAPAGRDEAYAMAGRLFMFGWNVKVVKR